MYTSIHFIILLIHLLYVPKSIHPFILPYVHSSIIPSESFNQFVHYTIIRCLLISHPSIFTMDEYQTNGQADGYGEMWTSKWTNRQRDRKMDDR